MRNVFVDKVGGPWVSAVRTWVPREILEAEAIRPVISPIGADRKDEELAAMRALLEKEKAAKIRAIDKVKEMSAENKRLKQQLAAQQ